MKTLLLAFALAFAAGSAAAAEPDPARYSFVDVYRLTVAGPMSGPAPVESALEVPVRVATVQAQPAEPRFRVSPARQPEKWLLALAGLALAGWVAHRRLAHAL